jgi:hypothetical protein
MKTKMAMAVTLLALSACSGSDGNTETADVQEDTTLEAGDDLVEQQDQDLLAPDEDAMLPDVAPQHDVVADKEEPGLCPPAEPFGTEVGETLPEVEFTDCDGNQYTLHDLCQFEAGWFFTFAGW